MWVSDMESCFNSQQAVLVQVNKENQFNLTVIEKQKKVFAPLLITRIELQSWANLSTHPSLQIKSSFLCHLLLFSS